MFCYVLLCQLLAGPDFNLWRLLNGKHIPAPYSHHKAHTAGYRLQAISPPGTPERRHRSPWDA